MGNGRVLVIHRESWLASWRWVGSASRFKLRQWVKEKEKEIRAYGIGQANWYRIVYIIWDIIEQLIDVTLTSLHWPSLTFTDLDD
jgi:hypothetical protein